MKILMLAPEPFFQPRGTPISVYQRIKALSDLGHDVDLVTYHLGEDKEIKNLKISRIPNVFFIKKIKIGPSLKKIPLDFLLFLKASRMLLRNKYDLIFSHEEGALFGVILSKISGIPHIYDMHSSLPQQLENFDFSRSKLLKRVFLGMERFILKNSSAIIVICLDLLKQVEQEGYADKAILLENFIDFDTREFSAEEIRQKRKEFASEDKKIVLYAGNFQPYQGIPLLLEAASQIIDDRVVFVLVGESPAAVERERDKAQELGIAGKVFFTGQVPPSQMPLFISLADVLVSPRLSGTNTPLKIYSFLKSGKPVVATNLWTHTQVLSDQISVLVEPDAECMAEGISFALFDQRAQERANFAKEKAARDYTYSRYKERINQVLDKATGTPG
ncbi:MAG: glycosyltransferase family 4 protein [Candidatus Aminicenantaceae bacterium]|jgi:glycosyltransferase involved in cell wall biosynthesis